MWFPRSGSTTNTCMVSKIKGEYTASAHVRNSLGPMPSMSLAFDGSRLERVLLNNIQISDDDKI